MDLHTLPTPALILDRRKLEANAAAMTRRVRSLGARLRPHLKTAKSIDAARIALAGNFGGITVATLNEAEYFAAHGVRDIRYAVCVTPDKLARAAELLRAGVRLSLITDSAEVARALDEQGRALGVVYPTLIELDSGEHRTGVDPEGAALIDIAGVLEAAGGAELVGLLTHAGHAYGCRDVASIRRIAEAERDQAAMAARRLRDAGYACPEVSVGSTPTAVHLPSAEGVTEIRAGVYLFGDLFQADIGSCGQDDIAVSVLATVISHDRRRGHLLLDAGALALSKDLGTERHGYGKLVDIRGRDVLGDLRVANVHQEHGEVRGRNPLPFEALPIGARARVLPNHVCMTAAMHHRYYVVEGDSEETAAVWTRTNGWEPYRTAG